jgi:hypothetical protein
MYIDIEAAGCPNTCRHCSVSGHLPYGQLFSLDELRAIRSEWVPLTIRYEPTAHPDFPEIYQSDIADDHGGWLVSTGFGIAHRNDYRTVLEKMRGMGMHTVAFTFHGLREHHDWFVCHQGAFDDLLLATRRIKEFGFTPKWQIYVDHKGIGGVPALIELAVRECGELPTLSIPYHRVGGRLWHYEKIRPTLSDVQKYRLSELVNDPHKNSMLVPEKLTASALLQEWKNSTEIANMRHIFEPLTWPPSVNFEHLSLRIQRDRKVFLDPICSAPIYLGLLSEGKVTLLGRLEKLSPPPFVDIDPRDVQLLPEEQERLHPEIASLRYRAISKALAAKNTSQI